MYKVHLYIPRTLKTLTTSTVDRSTHAYFFWLRHSITCYEANFKPEAFTRPVYLKKGASSVYSMSQTKDESKFGAVTCYDKDRSSPREKHSGLIR